MRILTKTFRDTAATKIVLISPARHGIIQYVKTNQTVEMSVLLLYRISRRRIQVDSLMPYLLFVSKYRKLYSAFNQFVMKTSSYKQPCRYMYIQALFSLIYVSISFKFSVGKIVLNNKRISLPRSSLYCHVLHVWTGMCFV